MVFIYYIDIWILEGYNLLAWGEFHIMIVQAPEILIEKTNLPMLIRNLRILTGCNIGFPDWKKERTSKKPSLISKYQSMYL